MPSILELTLMVENVEQLRLRREKAACEQHAQSVCDAYGWKPTPFVWQVRVNRHGAGTEACCFSVPLDNVGENSLNFACFRGCDRPILAVEDECPACGERVYSEALTVPNPSALPDEIPYAANVLYGVLHTTPKTWGREMPNYRYGDGGLHRTVCRAEKG